MIPLDSPMLKRILSISRFQRNLAYLASGAFLLISLICAFAIIELLQMRHETEIHVATTSANFAKSMTLMFEGMVNTIDIALNDSADEFDEEIRAGKINPAKFTGYLSRQQKHLPVLPYVRATDELGNVIYGEGLTTPSTNVADRDYFSKHRDNPNLGLFIEKPIYSRINGKWVWPFSRRLNKADGSFAGVVYAAVYVEEITKILGQIKLNKGEVIALRHSGLGSIAGRNEATATYPIQVGDEKVSKPFLEALNKNSIAGTYSSDTTKLDNLRHTLSYQRSAKYGFIVNIGTTGDTDLKEWRNQVWISGLLLLALTLTISSFAILIGRSWFTQERDLAALNEAHDLANFGNYKIDLKSEIIRISPSLFRILGADMAASDMTIEHWLKLIKSECHGDMRDYLKHVVSNRLLVDQEYKIIRINDSQTRWLHIRGKLHDNSHGQPIALIGTVQDITERKLAEIEIESLAYFDMLTGLPNRRLLYDRLTHALAAGARSELHGALLILDLDNFKAINDIRGHHIGDLLLKEVACRLSSSVRVGDSVARLGGDEFVILLEGLSAAITDAAHQVEKVAEKILAALNRPYLLSGNEHHSTPSIGITLFYKNQQTADELIKRADTAMYEAKAAGRNTMKFFDPAMQRSVEAQFQLENDLRIAIGQNQFQLHYQPQVDSSGAIIGAEALIRWLHPEHGMVSPVNFIPVAEKNGLILPIGQWVLEAACTQLALWAKAPASAHLTLAVNVSALQFSSPQFVAQVIAVLDQTGAHAEKLKLELTEGLLLENADEVIVKMTVLKQRGVSFSLDDFGTGYSSLSYLKRLPLDQLKIDQTFVRDILNDVNDAAIAKTVVALGQSLGLSVIAEGVETIEQRDFLLSAGCHHYQGYFFSRPITITAFEEFLRKPKS